MCALFDDGISREREKRLSPDFCAGCAYLDKTRTDGVWCDKFIAEVKGLYVQDLAYLGCPRADVERKSFHNRKQRR